MDGLVDASQIGGHVVLFPRHPISLACMALCVSPSCVWLGRNEARGSGRRPLLGLGGRGGGVGIFRHLGNSLLQSAHGSLSDAAC